MAEQFDKRMLVVREAYRALYTYHLHILSMVRSVAASLSEFSWGGLATDYDEPDFVTESWSPNTFGCCVLSGTPLLAPYFLFFRNRSKENGREHCSGDELLVLYFVADEKLIDSDDEEVAPIPMSTVLTGVEGSRSYVRLALMRCIAPSSGKTWDGVLGHIDFADRDWEVVVWPRGKNSRYHMVHEDIDESVGFDKDTLIHATKAFVERARAILTDDADLH